MNSTTVCIVFYYGGELRVNDDFIPTYIGGKNHPVQIPRRIRFEELQKRIMKSLKIDPTRFFLNLVGRFPIGAGFIASPIDDEEVSEAILTAACAQPIVVYVEAMELMGRGREVNNIEECDRARSSTEYIAPSSQLSPPVECYGTEAREHDFFAGTSSAVMGDLEDNEINVVPTEDVGYETMPSGGSSDDDEEEDDDCAERPNLLATGSSLSARDLIVDYSVRTSHTEEHLVRNNDYLRSAETAREWDEDLTFDGPSDHSVFEEDNCIPDELFEHMCFQFKKQLQFAIRGWSIINNVEYVICASNQLKFTARCRHHSNPSRPCLWSLHARSVKRLGGLGQTDLKIAWTRTLQKVPGFVVCVRLLDTTGRRVLKYLRADCNLSVAVDCCVECCLCAVCSIVC